ncbi:unnamed protein product [Linum trigynum]|uniref:C3H1-type domain-containing protein n=1 Tax=Linum trigynum TaxID=586398 RepID=A0AAV2FVD0_9ROSI
MRGICHDVSGRDRVDHLKNAVIWLSCYKRGKGGDISDKALSAYASFQTESGCGYEGDSCKKRHNWSEAIAVSLMSPRQGETSWHAYAERLVLRKECTSDAARTSEVYVRWYQSLVRLKSLVPLSVRHRSSMGRPYARMRGGPGCAYQAIRTHIHMCCVVVGDLNRLKMQRPRMSFNRGTNASESIG